MITRESHGGKSGAGGWGNEERYKEAVERARNGELKVIELEERIRVMTLERDKIITDYENYIDKIEDEKSQLKNLEGMVAKLEKEKTFLNEEIEKVRSIKMMLENRLTAYNESSEVKRYLAENQHLKQELDRFRDVICVESGYEGDPKSMNLGTAFAKYRNDVATVVNNQNNLVEENIQKQRRIDELEDQLKWAKNDANSGNTNEAKLKNLEAQNAQLMQALQQAQKANPNVSFGSMVY